MKIFSHVFTTWLWAHILHAVLFTIFDYINTGSFEFAFFVVVLLVGPIVSIPALLVSSFLFQLLFLVQSSNRLRLLLWVVFTAVALISNLLLFRLFESFAFLKGLQFITPALIACCATVLLRRNQLFSLFTLNEFENESYLV